MQLWQDVRRGVRYHRREIDEAGKLDLRGALEAARDWAAGALAHIDLNMRGLREGYADRKAAWFPRAENPVSAIPRRDHAHDLIARYTLIGGLFAATLEVTLASILSIALLALRWYFALATGVGITVCLAFLVMAAIFVLVVGKDPARARASTPPLLYLLGGALPTTLILMGVFFATRGVDWELLERAFGWDTTALAIDLPIIAGALLSLHGLYNWSGEYEDKYQRLIRAQQQARELFDFCDRELAQLPPQLPGSPAAATVPQPEPEARAQVTPLKAATAALVGLAVLATLSPRPAAADPAPVVRVWIDDTMSVDPDTRTVVLNTLGAALPALTRANNVGTWQIFGFGDAAWRETAFYQASVPAWREPVCTPPPRSEAAILFKPKHEDHGCTDRRVAAQAAYRSAVDDTLGGLKTALLAHRPVPARCTAISDLLQRLSNDTPAINVVISDGVETCRRMGLKAIAAPTDGSRTIFVVLDAEADTHGRSSLADRFAQRRLVLLRAAPWLDVVAPYRMGDQLVAPIAVR